ncbi:hypothetical protein RS130_19385 [Paraglaciecola aquimarina]|uniref:Uncharacterized protein n=1 Tax=Paraglaciecola aquimarina TaxID=1235557 RepID=A0ABU3T0H2_9ALTE|nr:hypothetical protein [Paraglaciecola aquimarina]MDU0355755.1 hypothetical protein [Paraglaciecola aquimarina]
MVNGKLTTSTLVVTSVNLGYKKIRVNGSSRSKKRVVHLRDDSEAPRVGEAIIVTGKLEKLDFGYALVAANWMLAPLNGKLIFDFLLKQPAIAIQVSVIPELESSAIHTI